jgi:Flp pilus assembly protein TadG
MKSLLKKVVTKKDGQVLILAALCIMVLLGFTAFAIDIGSAYVAKSDLQNATDASALAGAKDILSTDIAISTAFNYAVENGLKVTQNGVMENGDTVTVTSPYNGDSTKIEVVCTRTVDFFFARILGITETEVSARAVAEKGIAASVPWIVPFVIAQPIEFNYDEVYVMRMYGGGPYPNGYQYPYDYRNDSVYKNYPLTGTSTNIYTTVCNTSLKKTASSSSTTLTTIPSDTQITYNYAKKVGTWKSYTTWYNVTYNNYTGFIKKQDAVLKIISTTGNIYPYQFDYMNVYIKDNTGFSQYVDWLENGYYDTFSVDEEMYYYAPSSGGKTSVDAFSNRTTRDSNTDYTKAKLGDARVILIPVVNSILDRNTADKTPITIIGFAAFFIEEVHKNTYGETFWFEGRFLNNINVDSNNVTTDANADFGVNILKLVE